MGQSKVWISILILLVIGLHAVPVLHRGLQKKMWPILDWGMYKWSRPAGPIQANKMRIIGTTLKGDKQAVTRELVGSSGLALRGLHIIPMWEGDSSAARQLLRRINQEREDPFVELRLESEKFTVTDTGVVRTQNPSITYRFDPSEAR